MTQTHSKSRQQAEIAFSRIQTGVFAEDHQVEAPDSLVRAREAKTLRLREARLASELDARTAAIALRLRKPAKMLATP